MKPRIKTDSTILGIIIISTFVLWGFRNLYSYPGWVEIFLKVAGLIAILEGNLLRMSARGHKKAHSKTSRQLVVSGPYTLVRNPMYLGSFLMGLGFAILLWPWWLVIVFAILFYMRFNIQMTKEEALLAENFGKEYREYCAKVPRFFPPFRILKARTLKRLLIFKRP